jgi:hypothetical protein
MRPAVGRSPLTIPEPSPAPARTPESKKEAMPVPRHLPAAVLADRDAHGRRARANPAAQDGRRRGTPAVVARFASLTIACGVLLAACGGSGSGSGSTASLAPTPTPTPTAAAGAGAGGGQPRTPPGVSGTAAAVNGSTIEVQNPSSGQVTVTVTGSTTFSQTVGASESALAVGDCVTVVGTSGGGATGATAAPTGGTGPISARSVEISAPTGGSCARAGFGGFGGAGGAGGTGGGRPTGTPKPRASGGPAGRRGFGGQGGGGAFGTVTSISGATFVVRTTPAARSRASATPAPAGGVSRTVTVGSSTNWTRLEPATAASLKVGECLTAVGPADSTGAVTARSVSIRPAAAGGCFAGRGQGPG